MQKVDRAGEPTMEEILASIRQIIAEEPANGRPLIPTPSPSLPAATPSASGSVGQAAAAPVTPSVAAPNSAAKPVEASRPAQAFTTGPALGSAGESAKSTPANSPIAALGRLGGDLPFPLRPLGEARPNATTTPAAASAKPTATASAPGGDGLAQRTMPASDFGMFVPRRLEEALAQGDRGDQSVGKPFVAEPRQAAPSAGVPAPGPTQVPAASPTSGQPASRLAADIAALAPKPLKQPGDVLPPTGGPSPVASGAPGPGGLNGTPAPKPSAAPAAPEFAVVRPAPQPVTPPVAATPAPSQPPAPAPVAAEPVKPVASEAAKPIAAAKPAAAAPAAVPSAPVPAPTAASAAAVASKAVVTLAGVAEAMKAAPAGGPATPAATDLTPVKDAPVKTLEDAVVDLLRPMLRNWLDENMPRIVEKALRIEVAEQLKRTVPKQG